MIELAARPSTADVLYFSIKHVEAYAGVVCRRELCVTMHQQVRRTRHLQCLGLGVGFCSVRAHMANA